MHETEVGKKMANCFMHIANFVFFFFLSFRMLKARKFMTNVTNARIYLRTLIFSSVIVDE